MNANKVRVTTAQPCRMSAMMFSVLNTLMGRLRMVDTLPVKRVLYILQAVRGTTPSQATATRV